MTTVEKGKQGASVSPLDRAWELRLTDRPAEALAWATAALQARPEDDEAAWLLAELVAEQRTPRPEPVGQVLRTLARRWGARGELPRAVAAVHALAPEDTEARRELLRWLGQRFGRDSEALREGVLLPPPALPAEVTPPEERDDLDGLVERALGALEGWLMAAEPPDESAPVPPLPLFSALPAEPLRDLLDSLEVRRLASEQAVLREGERGEEAFVLVRGSARVTRGTPAEGPLLARLGPGAVFGEMALVSEAPRAATVVAEEPVVLLVLRRDVLERLAGRHPEVGEELGRFAHGRMVANLVRHSPVLSALPAAERPRLMERFEARRFEPGQRLVVQGEEPEGLYLLASGAVEVVTRDEDGERLRLAGLGPGEVVGEISLVLRRPATADVVAVAPTVALRLAREAFREAIAAHPRLLNELYELATKREEETRSVLAQEALDAEEVVLL